jgi:hypothetical protein
MTNSSRAEENGNDAEVPTSNSLPRNKAAGDIDEPFHQLSVSSIDELLLSFVSEGLLFRVDWIFGIIGNREWKWTNKQQKCNRQKRKW